MYIVFGGYYDPFYSGGCDVVGASAYLKTYKTEKGAIKAAEKFLEGKSRDHFVEVMDATNGNVVYAWGT